MLERYPSSRWSAAAAIAAALVCNVSAPPRVQAQAAQGLLSLLQFGGSEANHVFPDASRSAFDDTGGWWSLVRPVDELTLRVRRDHDEPITNRLTSDRGTAFDRMLRVDLATPLDECLGHGYGVLQYERPDRATTVAGHDGGANLFGGSGRVRCGLRLVDVVPGLSAQAVGEVWRDGDRQLPSAAGVGLRYSPSSVWAVQWHRAVSVGDEHAFGTILDDPISVRSNLRSQRWELAGRLSPWHRLVCELAFHRVRFQPHVPSDDRETYQIEPGGDSQGWTASLGLQAGANHRWYFRFRDEQVDVEAAAFWGGQQFGKLNYVRAYLKSRSLGWRMRVARASEIQAEFETASLDGAARAKVESWPFTDTVIDLLGISKIYKGWGSVSWQRLTATAAGPAPWTGRWRLGVSWFDITPTATIESWRPAFLIFGRTDYQQDDLVVERVRLASLLMETNAELGRCDLMLSLQQFVWGDIDEQGQEGAPTGPSDDGDDGDDKHGWFGGTYLTVGIAMRLG